MADGVASPGVASPEAPARPSRAGPGPGGGGAGSARGRAGTGRRAPGGDHAAAALPYVQALPLAATLGAFLLVPLGLLVVVSFFDYDSVRIIPDFVLTNYREVLGSAVTWRTYANTLKYAFLVWAITLLVGFPVAYFLAFHVRSVAMQTALFLACTVPFLTSNIIRMISWVPFLGREGLVNSALLRAGAIAIGSVFVLTLVMGDFITVRLMGGGQRASVGLMISNQISLLQYPAACANAVVLLAVVLLLIGAVLRVVDIRKEL